MYNTLYAKSLSDLELELDENFDALPATQPESEHAAHPDSVAEAPTESVQQDN